MKPAGYWNDKELCRVEALKYTKKTDFQKKSSAAYASAHKHGWLDEICSHMPIILRPRGYWTFELVLEKALLCKTRKEFVQRFNAAHQAAFKNKWFEVYSHMDYIFRPNGYWTKEKCKDEALKYNTVKEFRKHNSVAYYVILKNGWYDELCPHLFKNKNKFWEKIDNDYEYCKEIALKYKTRSELASGDKTVYNRINQFKWCELYDHMEIKSTNKFRYIYAFEFEDKHVYVGLTWNTNKRYSDHFTGDTSERSAVKEYFDKTNIPFVFRILTEKPVPADVAGKYEKFFLNEYKSNGWIPLNKATTGSLGGSKPIWTKEKCIEELKKCVTITDFAKKIPPHVRSIIYKNNWFNELTEHLIKDKNLPGYWDDKELCRSEALKHKTRSEYQKLCSGAYKSAVRHEWLDEFIPLPPKPVKESKIIPIPPTKEECHVEALKYKTRNAFHKNAPLFYNRGKKENWLTEICSHMKYNLNQYTAKALTKDECSTFAAECNTKTEFYHKYNTPYKTSVRNGWIDEICSHMEKKSKPMGYWKDSIRVIEEGKKYRTRSEFQKKSSGAFKAAHALNLMDIIFPKKISL